MKNSENELKNLGIKVQETLDNLNDKLDGYTQKYNEISSETKSKSKRSKKINFNSLRFILLSVCIFSFIVYIVLKQYEPDFIKEKIKNEVSSIGNEVSSLKLYLCSFAIGICLTIVLYFGYYVYINFNKT